MKKIAIALTLVSIHASAFAQELTCLDKLMPYNRNSGLHLVTRDEYHDPKEVLDADGAKAAFSFLINTKLLCKANEISVKIQPTCSQTLADIPQSNSCFIFTNAGYFVITRDNVRNTNFIFSKDKRFSEQAGPEL